MTKAVNAPRLRAIGKEAIAVSRTLSVLKWLEIVLGAGLTLRVLMSGNSDWGVLYFLLLCCDLLSLFFN